MSWFDIAAVAALVLSLANLIVLNGLLSDIRMVTRSVDRQLEEARRLRASERLGRPQPI